MRVSIWDYQHYYKKSKVTWVCSKCGQETPIIFLTQAEVLNESLCEGCFYLLLGGL